MMRRAGITLAGVLVALVLVAIVAVLLIPAAARSARHGKVMECAARLKTLHRACEAGPIPSGGPRGSAFWISLAPRVSAETLRCPLVNLPDAPDCQYWGPARDFADLDGKDLLGCDAPANHGVTGREGGNVLRRSGEVVTGPTEAWIDASRRGVCLP